MNYSFFYVHLVHYCLAVFEVPKFYYILLSCLNEQPYHVFPQVDGPLSSSDPFWILSHYVTAFAIIGLLSFEILRRELGSNALVKPDFLISILFVNLIIPNIKNLAGFPPEHAIVINTIFLIATLVSLFNGYRFLLLVVVSIPSVLLNELWLIKCGWWFGWKLLIWIGMIAYPLFFSRFDFRVNTKKD